MSNSFLSSGGASVVQLVGWSDGRLVCVGQNVVGLVNLIQNVTRFGDFQNCERFRDYQFAS